MLMDPRLQATTVNNMLLVALLKKLEQLDQRNERIEGRLIEKKPRLMVDEALDRFRDHLKTGISKRGRKFKKPENYEYVLSKFEGVFGGRNLADITAEEVDVFLKHFWSTPGTLKQRRNELSAFFSWAIMLLQKRRQPAFTNPCTLLDPIHHTVKTPEFVETKAIKALIESAIDERQWLMFAILATAGLRISELLSLKKGDVNGRVLTLHETKSGNETEIAVIPEIVAKRLAQYGSDFEPEERLFALCRSAVYKALRARGQNPHGLRKWCMTDWDRRKEEAMVAFVSRHSRTTLRDRYVAPLTPEEAMRKQRVIEKELWG
jgi:integrase